MDIRSITAPNPGPFTLDGTRTWLVGDSIVIDPGPSIDSHIAAIHAAQPKLETIFITHRHADHAPAALALKQRTGARILAPRGVLDGHRDGDLAGGERFELPAGSLEVIATPGHTEEHVCFLTSQGDLFSGDTILGWGTTTIFPPDGDMAAYLRSLRLLQGRAPKRIFPGHGPTRDDAAAVIDHYIAHRLERESQILTAMATDAMTISALRSAIYPDLQQSLHEAAGVQLLAHLIKLESEGRAKRLGETWSAL